MPLKNMLYWTNEFTALTTTTKTATLKDRLITKNEPNRTRTDRRENLKNLFIERHKVKLYPMQPTGFIAIFR